MESRLRCFGEKHFFNQPVVSEFNEGIIPLLDDSQKLMKSQNKTMFFHD